MILKEILHIYHQELDSIYGKEEVDSFFNLLIEHYLELKRITLVMSPGFAITKTEEQPLFEALAALKLHKPIQYIIGETEFYGLPFLVNQHTLIPRPETEELVDWILRDSEQKTKVSEAINILDIGTGSGCIAISLAKELGKTKVSAVDVSEDALKVAVKNSDLNKVNVAFEKTDILNSDSWEVAILDSGFDIIVSNPPYVRYLEKSKMKSNVIDNEPHLALFVEDDDPLLFYKAIGEFAQSHLKIDGSLYFEINEGLGSEMKALLKSYNFKAVELKTDIFGKERMLKGILRQKI